MANDAASKSYTYRKYVGNSCVYLLTDGRAREYFVIQNEGLDLFVRLGPNANLGEYTYRIPPGGVLEIHDWSGVVTAIRSGTASFCMCTETV